MNPVVPVRTIFMMKEERGIGNAGLPVECGLEEVYVWADVESLRQRSTPLLIFGFWVI